MQVFKSPKTSLGDLGAQNAANLIASSNDVAVVIDQKGIVRDVAFNRDDLSLELDGRGRWLGTEFSETVTSESRQKVKALLQDVMTRRAAAWRQVNHPSPTGGDIPVMYSAIDIGRKDRYVVVGRDLRQLATMQQRLIEAQQKMERDYVRLRQAETRYRLLFQVASEAVLVVDASSRGVVDANPAALSLLEEAAPALLQSDFVARFDAADANKVAQTLATVSAKGRDASVSARIARNGREAILRVSLFRQDNASLFLIRVSADDAAPEGHHLKATALLARYFEQAPDGLVITDHQGRILRANTAFADLVQMTDSDQTRGETLDRWVGRAGVDFDIAFANLKQNGSVKLFSTILRGELGVMTDIEMSAVALPDTDGKANFGYVIRDVERRLTGAGAAPARELPRSVAELTEMIGRVPLRDLVRETTDVIEKLSIEAALELTGDNRASAAEMLGLSRQSLYVKLRRFGLAEPTSDEDDDG